MSRNERTESSSLTCKKQSCPSGSRPAVAFSSNNEDSAITRIELPLGWGFLQVTGSVDDRWQAVATAQRGLVSAAQLRAIGLTRSQIETRLTRAQLRSVYRGVYTAVPGSLSPLAAATAALLACQPNAILSHVSALNLMPLLPRQVVSGTTHVLVTNGQRGLKLEGITLHQTASLAQREVRRIERLPVTSPERTLLDCAPLLAPHQLETALDEALAQRLTSLAKLEATLERHPHRRGLARLRALITDRDRPTVTKSVAEARFLELIRAARLPDPVTQAIVYGQSIDAYWPEAHFGVEVDGRTWHVQPRKFENDRRKDQILRDHGITVARTTWNQITNESLELIAHVSGQISAGRVRAELSGGAARAA